LNGLAANTDISDGIAHEGPVLALDEIDPEVATCLQAWQVVSFGLPIV
jgi:hypothetical protein